MNLNEKRKIQLHNVYLLSKEINEWSERLLWAEFHGTEREIKYLKSQTAFYNKKMEGLLTELGKKQS